MFLGVICGDSSRREILLQAAVSATWLFFSAIPTLLVCHAGTFASFVLYFGLYLLLKHPLSQMWHIKGFQESSRITAKADGRYKGRAS